MTLEVCTRSPGDNTSFQFNVTIINISDKSIVESESLTIIIRIVSLKSAKRLCG